MLVMSIIQLAGVITGNAGIVPDRDTGMDPADLSNAAFYSLWIVLHQGREKRRNRAGRGG